MVSDPSSTQLALIFEVGFLASLQLPICCLSGKVLELLLAKPILSPARQLRVGFVLDFLLVPAPLAQEVCCLTCQAQEYSLVSIAGWGLSFAACQDFFSILGTCFSERAVEFPS